MMEASVAVCQGKAPFGGLPDELVGEQTHGVRIPFEMKKVFIAPSFVENLFL